MRRCDIISINELAEAMEGDIMKRAILFVVAVICLLLPNANADAWGSLYPGALGNGKYIMVDAHQGVGRYADMSSRAVQIYKPPYYQIAINVVSVVFSEDYYRVHGTYIGSPYEVHNVPIVMRFRYNYDTKQLWVEERGNTWKYWNIYQMYSHADGEPLYPYSAEAAFVAAYNMRFFDKITGYGGERVISEDFYKVLGV